MQPPSEGAKPPRPATSEDIPRAAEFLLLFLMRWALFGLAAGAGLLLIAAWTSGWPRWAIATLAAFMFAGVACGASLRPRGGFRFDRVGPCIIVPPARPGRAGDEPRGRREAGGVPGA